MARPPLVFALELGPEPDALLVEALLDDGVQPDERPPADEEDVARVHPDEFLMRVLAAALRRHVRDRAFDQLQERLLYAPTGHVARDGGAVALPADLVDLVDIDDAAFRPLHVVVGDLEEFEDDVLHVLADIAGLRARRGVAN